MESAHSEHAFWMWTPSQIYFEAYMKWYSDSLSLNVENRNHPPLPFLYTFRLQLIAMFWRRNLPSLLMCGFWRATGRSCNFKTRGSSHLASEPHTTPGTFRITYLELLALISHHRREVCAQNCKFPGSVLILPIAMLLCILQKNWGLKVLPTLQWESHLLH